MDAAQDRPVGVGILGAANIARKNCRALTKTDQLRVVAVGSRDKSKAAALLEEWGLTSSATAYGSYEEVLSDPAVDAVYIPLPSALHVDWVRRAAEKGKHILLEKPIAVSVADTDAIVEACAKNHVQLMDGTMWVHGKRAADMAAVLRSGALGALRDVTSTFTFNAPPAFDANVRSKKDADPLGALGDMGWYCIRAILWAYDYEAPLSVTAHPGAAYTPDGVPIHMGAELLFPGGRRGHFECGFDRALTQYLEIAGTEGTVRLDDFVIPAEEHRHEYVVTREHGLRDLDTWDGTQRDRRVVHTERQQEVLMWEAFAACVRGARAGAPPEPRWPREATLTQKVVCAVLESAQRGITVEFTQ